MIEAIRKIMKAMEVGEELKDPAKWKNTQDTATLVSVIIAAIISVAKLAGYELPINDDQLVVIAGIVASCLGLANSYLIKATSRKVGLKQ
jgi:hypothetical protein